MRLSNAEPASHVLDGFFAQAGVRPRGWTRLVVIGFTAWVFGACLITPVLAQTITVVGTAHLKGLERSPSAEQIAHTVEALSAFESMLRFFNSDEFTVPNTMLCMKQL